MSQRLSPMWLRGRAALDPERSFIVQAPAGSGKTELLIQRFLALLARVERPEELLAITFTRKAAGEMRDRVLERCARRALQWPARAPHDARRWPRARRAERDAERGWNLDRQSRRGCAIQTIDALCQRSRGRCRCCRGLAPRRDVVEDAQPLYASAARAHHRAARIEARRRTPWRCCSSHLDNNVRRSRVAARGDAGAARPLAAALRGHDGTATARRCSETALARAVALDHRRNCARSSSRCRRAPSCSRCARARERGIACGRRAPIGACAGPTADAGRSTRDWHAHVAWAGDLLLTQGRRVER